VASEQYVLDHASGLDMDEQSFAYTTPGKMNMMRDLSQTPTII
jgi:hypothetical protein